jgi:hypothetical protein
MLFGGESRVQSEPSEPMDAQRINRTFRPYALVLGARHDVPIDQALLALARAASMRPGSRPLQIAQRVRAQTEKWIVQSKHKWAPRSRLTPDGRS